MAEPLFDRELQKDQTFTGIGVAGTWLEMESQLFVGFDEGEIGEPARVLKKDARGQLAPAIVARKIAPIAVLL